MKDSKFNDAQKQNLDDLFTTLGINSSSTPFPNASNMVSNNRPEAWDRTKEDMNIERSTWYNPHNRYVDYNSNPNASSGYGGGMQDVSVQRGSGGTGGGSEESVGNMEGSQLLQLNPYISKNVVSFNNGGMFGEFAKYNHNQIRREEFMRQNNTNPYQVQAENGMRMPQYNDGGMMQQQQMPQQTQQQMPQQTESYAKQANDMVALAQLEAFGKKFLSQTQGQMPPEIAQAMNQQGMSIDPPMANKGMKYPKYDNGGKSFLSSIKAAQDRVMKTDIQKGFVPDNWRGQVSGMGGYESYINSGQPLLASNMKDKYAPTRANHGMKMKRYTQGGRF